jgi:hypothetical protein
MKPHMKTSELNPQRKEKGDKGKGEPKNDETGKHIKRDNPQEPARSKGTQEKVKRLRRKSETTNQGSGT